MNERQNGARVLTEEACAIAAQAIMRAIEVDTQRDLRECDSTNGSYHLGARSAALRVANGTLNELLRRAQSGAERPILDALAAVAEWLDETNQMREDVDGG